MFMRLIFLRIIKYSAANAFADMRAVYTWKTWVFGWLGRMLAQVAYFVVLGHAIGGSAGARYLVIGNALMTSVIESLSVIASSAWERQAGTLALIAASPARPTWVFVGRSLQWPISGIATSLVALFTLGPIFGAHWAVGQVAPVVCIVVLTAVTTYFWGLFLAALILNTSGLRNVVSNVAYLTMMAVCGVQVPVDYWPRWVGIAADAIPLTHLVAALRALADGDGATHIVALALRGLAVGFCWLIAADWAFRRLLSRGKVAGTIDFAS
ncbi:ABC transporter permease [Nocardia terpenica]|uniref:ABC transporter permease n=1 Tax=Nocardia terpenica TaxID=455432 RepID=UPI002FE1B963